MRESAAVGTPLDIILSSKGIQASSFPADLSAHEGEIGDRKGVLSAMGALTDAHSPIHRGTFTAGVHSCGLANVIRCYACHLLSPLWGEGFK